MGKPVKPEVLLIDENSFPEVTRILAVDDSPAMLRTIETALEELGYGAIITASDGTIAWEMIEESLENNETFDLIISDLVMEEMSGLELLKKVRANETIGDTPFIMLTGHGELNEVISAAQAKVSCYMIKPFKPETLGKKMLQVYQATHLKKAS